MGVAHRVTLFTVLALAALAILVFDGVSADDYEWEEVEGNTFLEGFIEYGVIGPAEVEALYVHPEAGTDIVIPELVTHGIDTYSVISIASTFCDYNQIVSISIPISVSEIDINALSSKSLASIDVDENNYYFFEVDNVLFNYHYSSLVRYPPASPETVFYCPDGIASFDDYAFADAVNLQEILGIPDKFRVIGEGTFYGCTSLSLINNINGENTLPDHLIYIGSMAFGMCTSLSQITLPESLIVIDAIAFGNTAISTFHIPPSVHSIEMAAFSSCYSLEYFTVDESNTVYTTIDGVLFSKDSHLQTYTLIQYPPAKSDTLYIIPQNVNNVVSGAFTSANNLREVIINDLFISIPNGMMGYMTSLERIYIPPTTEEIGYAAFVGCTKLRTVDGGFNVIDIGDWAFAETAVTSIIGSNKVESIGEYAYAHCLNLEKAILPASLKTLHPYAFNESYNLNYVELKGKDADLKDNSLSIGTTFENVEITLSYHAGYEVSPKAFDEHTLVNFLEVGKRPYPYENLIGVAVCILVVYGIFRLFREV